MALGKEIGGFSLQMEAGNYSPGPGQNYTAEVSFSGPVTGELDGMHRGTLTVVTAPGAKVGTYTYCGVTYRPNGDAVALTSRGVSENIGNNKRRLRGVNHFSDDRIAAVEGEADVVTGTFTGQLFEWN